MKKLAIALVVLAALAAMMVYNVRVAETEPIPQTPGPLEQATMDLHNQLKQAEEREAQFEKLYWDSPDQLRVLISSHQHRIERLAGNKQAGEVVGHDREAIARVEKRIAELEARRQEQSAEAQAQASGEAIAPTPAHPKPVLAQAPNSAEPKKTKQQQP